MTAQTGAAIQKGVAQGRPELSRALPSAVRDVAVTYRTRSANRAFCTSRIEAGTGLQRIVPESPLRFIFNPGNKINPSSDHCFSGVKSKSPGGHQRKQEDEAQGKYRLFTQKKEDNRTGKTDDCLESRIYSPVRKQHLCPPHASNPVRCSSGPKP